MNTGMSLEKKKSFVYKFPSCDYLCSVLQPTTTGFGFKRTGFCSSRVVTVHVGIHSTHLPARCV